MVFWLMDLFNDANCEQPDNYNDKPPDYNYVGDFLNGNCEPPGQSDYCKPQDYNNYENNCETDSEDGLDESRDDLDDDYSESIRESIRERSMAELDPMPKSTGSPPESWNCNNALDDFRKKFQERSVAGAPSVPDSTLRKQAAIMMPSVWFSNPPSMDPEGKTMGETKVKSVRAKPSTDKDSKPEERSTPDGSTRSKYLKDRNRYLKEQEQEEFERCEDCYLPLIMRWKLAVDDGDAATVEKLVLIIAQDVGSFCPSFIESYELAQVMRETRYLLSDNDEGIKSYELLWKEMWNVYTKKAKSVPDDFKPVKRQLKQDMINAFSESIYITPSMHRLDKSSTRE